MTLIDSVRSHGKVGLLVDDAQGAAARVARKLYGSDRLPPWWTVAGSIHCALSAVREFCQIFAPGLVPPPPELELVTGRQTRPCGLLLVDQYLQLRCGPQGRPVSIDGDTDAPEVADLRRLLIGLNELDRNAQRRVEFRSKFFTSYPTIVSASGDKRGAIDWRLRGIDDLDDLRRSLVGQGSGDAFWMELMRYGPVPDSRSVARPAPHGVSDEEIRTRDRLYFRGRWGTVIKGLVEAFKTSDQDKSVPVVLLTGSGISLRSSLLGPGLPDTGWLITESCKRLVRGLPDDLESSWSLRGHGLFAAGSPSLPSPPPGSAGCYCPLSLPVGTARDATPEHFLEKLLDSMAADPPAGPEKFNWEFEDLFGEKATSTNKRSIQPAFHEAFRSVLHHFDHGFTYQHWLAAQLPWARIITTNFDGFHERAAWSVASSLDPNRRKRVLSLGNVFPAGSSFGPTSRPDAESLRENCRLFKPYGTLFSPQGIAMSDAQIERCQADFRYSLESVFRDYEKAWLVVVGHSMRDRHIGKVFEDLSRTYKSFDAVKIVWVDPGSYYFYRARKDGGKAAPSNAQSAWLDLMVARTDLADEDRVNRQGVLPATALEFIYDLFVAFRKGRLPA